MVEVDGGDDDAAEAGIGEVIGPGRRVEPHVNVRAVGVRDGLQAAVVVEARRLAARGVGEPATRPPVREADRPQGALDLRDGRVAGEDERQPRPRAGLSAGHAHAVMDRDLGDARARGAGLGQQLGADEGTAGPQVEARQQLRDGRAGTRSPRRGPAGPARRG